MREGAGHDDRQLFAQGVKLAQQLAALLGEGIGADDAAAVRLAQGPLVRREEAVDVRRADEEDAGLGGVQAGGLEEIIGAEKIRIEDLAPLFPRQPDLGQRGQMEDPVRLDAADGVDGVGAVAQVEVEEPRVGGGGAEVRAAFGPFGEAGAEDLEAGGSPPGVEGGDEMPSDEAGGAGDEDALQTRSRQ